MVGHAAAGRSRLSRQGSHFRFVRSAAANVFTFGIPANLLSPYIWRACRGTFVFPGSETLSVWARGLPGIGGSNTLSVWALAIIYSKIEKGRIYCQISLNFHDCYFERLFKRSGHSNTVRVLAICVAVLARNVLPWWPLEF